uniref:Uncharacterized protein n=1 Tax=Setaria italica TaxID=4555 RepID=K3YNJ2_SETIT
MKRSSTMPEGVQEPPMDARLTAKGPRSWQKSKAWQNANLSKGPGEES